MDRDDLLNQKETEDGFELEDAVLKTTSGLLEKAWRVSDLVQEIGKRPYEWMGYLIAKESDLEVARDFIIAPEQSVATSYVIHDPSYMKDVIEELENYSQDKGERYRIIGWIHNHGSFGTFHSSTDDNNTRVHLNTTFLETKRKSAKREIELLENGEAKLENGKIYAPTKGGAELEFSVSDEDVEELEKKYSLENGKLREIYRDLISSSRATSREDTEKGFCYSIVVNNRRDVPYAEVARKQKAMVSGKERFLMRRAELDIEDAGLGYDDNLLREEIRKKVRFPRKSRKFFEGHEFESDRV